MLFARSLGILCLTALPLIAGKGVGTLTIVENEGSFGLIDITVDAPGTADSDTSVLTGTVSIELEVDTDTDAPTGVTAVEGNIVGTQVAFSGSNFLFGYS